MQAAIRLATTVINLETRKEMLGHPVKVNVLDVLRNVKLSYDGDLFPCQV